MERRKEISKTLSEFRHQTSHLVGEVNFIRNENDLIKVCINILQSSKVISQYLESSRRNHALTKNPMLIEHHFMKLEIILTKIMEHVNNVFSVLQRKNDKICIPATCVVFESVARVLLGIVANLYPTEKITEEILTSIISLVF